MFRWILIIILLHSTSMYAQSKRLMRYNMQQAQNEKDWNKAIFWARACLTNDSLNFKVRYNLACYLFQINEFKKAQVQFKRLLQMNPQFYEAHYQLAHIYKMQSKYMEARSAWNLFLKQSNKDSVAVFLDPTQYWGSQKSMSHFRKRSRLEIQNLILHHDSIWSKVPLLAVKVVTSINTPDSEIPITILDSSQWNFVRWNALYENEKRMEIPHLYKVRGFSETLQAYRFSDTLIKPEDTMASWNAISNIEIVERFKNQKHQIEVRNKKNNKWISTAPLNLGDENCLHPSIAQVHDTLMLFFSSNRPGGFGSFDIWYSALDTLGKIIYTRNAGPNVNTPENEFSPYFDTVCNRLYFSSTGHLGLGGFDIFFSNLNADNNRFFSTAENAGIPINSAQHDLHFKTSKNSRYLLLASNRSTPLKSGNCCLDIFMYKIDSVFSKTKDTSSTLKDNYKNIKQQLQINKPLALFFDNNQPYVGTAVSSYTTYYTAYSKQAAVYKNRFLKDTVMYKRINEFFLDSLPAAYLNLIAFKLRIQEALHKGLEIYIGVRAFASPLADKSFNLNLSKRRIESLRMFITDGLPQDKKHLLHINERPFGERDNARVSDSYTDLKNSVYSINAIRERVVYIEQIDLIQ